MSAIRRRSSSRNAQVLDPVIADGAHVDLCGKPEIQDLRDHIRRLEIEDLLGKRRRQHLPQLADVVGGGAWPSFSDTMDHAVIDADRRAVREGQIIGARRQTDIVDDQIEVVLGNDLADLVLDRLEDLLGHLDAGAGGART